MDVSFKTSKIMEKYYEEWDGKKFPVREVMFNVCDGMETIVKVAGIELWDAIENAHDVKFHPNHKDAVELDNDIYYYCEYGFIESDPTDEEIVDYLIKKTDADMKKPTRFWVEYNGKYVADYKSVLACLKFINRKGLQDDYDNTLRIIDNNGDMYNTISGNKINYNYG